MTAPEGMAAALVLTIDQGTSGTKCLLVDAAGQVVSRGSAPLGQQHPRPGWVEQDALEIWNSVQRAVAACLNDQDASRVRAIGLSTQRESFLAWARYTGQPLGPLIGWQDQRAGLSTALRAPGVADLVREHSGLPLDPMFSASKGAWLLDTHDPSRERARAGEICLGTVDAWLLYQLTGEHVTERGNASRTQLLNVRRGAWDAELLDLFGIPAQALPALLASDGPFPPLRPGVLPVPDSTPIAAVLGDSHAALFAHGAFRPGTVKGTYGTGSSVMGLLPQDTPLDPGVCLTVAWSARDTRQLAAEGNIRSTGATLRWLADLLGLTPGELADLARDVPDSPVVIVPAFGGLGAPWWDEQAVGLISNLTLGTTRAELAFAALDSVAQQVTDVVEAVRRSGTPVHAFYADGGATGNAQLMQRQADLLGVPVRRSLNPELSALGAAHLAGLTAGVWSDATLDALPRDVEEFVPAPDPAPARQGRARWAAALSRARHLPESVTFPLEVSNAAVS